MSVGTVFTTPLLAILEGCGLVTQISGLRMRQNLLSSAGLWLALGLGWKLYAVPVGATIYWACSIYWLWRGKGGFFWDMLRLSCTLTSKEELDWRQEVWPFQWKIASSGISSYVIFQTFIPIIYSTRGPAAAGQLGLSLSVMQTATGPVKSKAHLQPAKAKSRV